jgi:hypothetical protein
MLPLPLEGLKCLPTYRHGEILFLSFFILLYLSPLIPGIVSTGLISNFIHEYPIILPYSPFYTLSVYPPPSTGTNPLDKTCFIFLSSVYEKKTFLFV